MHRMRVAFVHKIVPLGVVAFLLFGAPLQLAAQESEAPVAERVSVIEWFSGAWSELATWLASDAPTSPRPESTVQADSGCTVDPHGRCGGL